MIFFEREGDSDEPLERSDFDPDHEPEEEPDPRHTRAIEKELDRQAMDDYEVTNHYEFTKLVYIAQRDGETVGWMACGNPVKNER